jgi:hypothetical protein
MPVQSRLPTARGSSTTRHSPSDPARGVVARRLDPEGHLRLHAPEGPLERGARRDAGVRGELALHLLADEHARALALLLVRPVGVEEEGHDRLAVGAQHGELLQEGTQLAVVHVR